VPSSSSSSSSCSYYYYQGQRGSGCSAVLTATGLVNEEWQISTPYRIETPEPIDIKFGRGD